MLVPLTLDRVESPSRSPLSEPTSRFSCWHSSLSLERQFWECLPRRLELQQQPLDIKPQLKLILFIEDTPHFRPAISARIDWKDRQSKSTRLRRGMILNNSEQHAATVVRDSRNHRTRLQEGIFQARRHFECHEEPRCSHSIDNGRRKIWFSRTGFVLPSARTFPES